MAELNMLGQAHKRTDELLLENQQLTATIVELRKGLEKVKDVLYDNMGWGHCIAADGRTVELWWKDPNFHGDATGKNIQEHQAQVHKALVEQADAIKALLQSPNPGEGPLKEPLLPDLLTRVSC